MKKPREWAYLRKRREFLPSTVDRILTFFNPLYFVFEVKFSLGTRRLIEEYQNEDDNSIDIMNFN